MIFHIVGITSVRFGYGGFFVSFEFVVNEQIWGERNPWNPVISRGWKWLGWNEVRWAEGTRLVYRMCFLFQVGSMWVDRF